MSKELNHIIRKAVNGDQKAYNEIYMQYRSMWFMISMRYGKNKMQSEDILQDGLIRIFNDLAKYDSKKSRFSTWSSRVLVNAALRNLQKSNWNETFVDIENAEDITDEYFSIIDEINTKELTLMIQSLPTGYRVVFNMYVLEGYSHKEIAEHLNISEGTSKSQLSKARKQLRHILESQLKVTRR